MSVFTIADSDLAGVKDKVVVITGASSGIGLATLNLLLQHGAKVFASDLNPLPSPLDSNVPFKKVDVTSWDDQVALFKAAHAEYGRIDHVFANAGISPSTTLLEDDVDEKTGDLLPPKLNTVNVNYIGVIYTVKLGLWYLRKNYEDGGSIVMTGSASSVQRFPPPDYTSTKHAVLGLLRSLTATVAQKNIPVRINAIAPAWTATNILPAALVTSLGDKAQSPDVAARSAIVLMADSKRKGELIYSEEGNFIEIENGDEGMLKMITKIVYGQGGELEGLVNRRAGSGRTIIETDS